MIVHHDLGKSNLNSSEDLPFFAKKNLNLPNFFILTIHIADLLHNLSSKKT